MHSMRVMISHERAVSAVLHPELNQYKAKSRVRVVLASTCVQQKQKHREMAAFSADIETCWTDSTRRMLNRAMPDPPHSICR